MLEISSWGRRVPAEAQAMGFDEETKARGAGENGWGGGSSVNGRKAFLLGR